MPSITNKTNTRTRTEGNQSTARQAGQGGVSQGVGQRLEANQIQQEETRTPQQPTQPNVQEQQTQQQSVFRQQQQKQQQPATSLTRTETEQTKNENTPSVFSQVRQQETVAEVSPLSAAVETSAPQIYPTPEIQSPSESQVVPMEATNQLLQTQREIQTAQQEYSPEKPPLPQLREQKSVTEKTSVGKFNPQYKPVSRTEEKPRIPSEPALSSARTKKNEKKNKNTAKDVAKDKNWHGNAVTDKLVGMADLRLDEVSVGSELILYALTQPNSELLSIIQIQTGLEFDPNSTTFFRDVIDAINAADLTVGTSKSPVNEGPSAQARTLRVHSGRGIGLHPTQAKSYNADFDGDDMTVRWNSQGLRPAMSYMIDQSGAVKIDPDFFMVPTLSIKTKDAIVSYLDNFILIDTEINNRQAIINAVADLCIENSSDNWSKLLKQIGEVAKLQTEGRYSAIATILGDIYESFRRIRILNMEINTHDESLYEARQAYPADQAIITCLTDLAAGVTPPNFQDFKVMMNRYIGEIKGKNVHFRIGADVAKLVKYNKNVQIGSEVELRDLYNCTMAAGISRRISNLSNVNSKAKYAASMIRLQVANEVRFPGDYPNIVEFFDRFVQVYSKYSSMVNLANLTFNMDMTVKMGGKGSVAEIDSNIGSMVTPFLNVYGEFTLNKLFGNYLNEGNKESINTGQSNESVMIPNKYRFKPVKRFSLDNRLYLSKNEISKYKEKTLDSYKRKDSNQKTIIDTTSFTRDILTLIADKRRSSASKYNKQMESSLEELSKITKAIKKEKQERNRDWHNYANELFNLTIGFSPDLFAYYGLDNPASFFDRDYGKLIVDAKDSSYMHKLYGKADMLGGIYVSMLVNKRIDKLTRREEYVDEILSGEANISSDLTEAQLNEAINSLRAEQEALSSSSATWQTIVRETRKTKSGSVWNDLKQNGVKALRNATGNTRAELNAKNFWSHPSKHESIVDFLIDPYVPRSLKNSVLSDVVRTDQKFLQVDTYEVAYQLELDENSIYSTVQSYEERPSVFDVMDSFNGSYDKWESRSRENIDTNFKDAYDAYGKREGALDKALKNLAEDSYYMNVSDDIFVDAIAYVMDKTFNTSEKSRQSPGPNALYQALMIQRAGINRSDVARSDNGLLGIIDPELITPRDIIKVLADETGNTSFTTYNEYGNPIQINRSTLTGSTSETDLWNFFNENRRLFTMIREHQVTVYGDSKDVTVTSSAINDSKTTLERSERKTNSDEELLAKRRIRAAMMDHYRFAGMVALFTQTAGQASRSQRGDYKANMKQLLDLIYQEALKKANSNEQYLIVNPLNLPEKNPIADLDNDMYVSLRDELNSTIISYIDEAVSLLPSNNLPNPQPVDRNFKIHDLQSVAMYYDVKQELSGAKTEVSTGIEGTETYKNAIWIASIMHKDSYSDVDEYSNEEIEELFAGCMTNAGIAIGDAPIEEIFKQVGDVSNLVVKVPEGFNVQDETLYEGYDQIPSIGRYFIIKRDKGAEEFNLKVKKFGDDGTDSISKVDQDKQFRTQDQIIAMIEDAYSRRGIVCAQSTLAALMQENDRSLGYNDMTIGDYTNLAEYMIVERVDPENEANNYIDIRSLEQLVYAIKNQVPFSVIDTNDFKALMDSSKAIADTVIGINNTENLVNPINDAIDIMNGIKIASTNKNRNQSVHRTVSSSFERNVELMNEIIERNNITEIKSQKEIEQISNGLADKAKLNGYYLLGSVGMNPVPQPGPTSLWLVESDTPRNIVEHEIERAKNLGITIGSWDQRNLPQRYQNDFVQLPGGLWIIPFFDMELNGSSSDAFVGAPGSFQRSADNIVWSYEDSFGEFPLGDSDAWLFDNFVNRITPTYRDKQEVSFADLFADTFAVYPDASFSVNIASEEEIRQWIINNYAGGPQIDLGISRFNRSYESERKRMEKRIQEFRENYNGGQFLESAKPNQIVSWARCVINPGTNNQQIVFAPIVLFQDVRENLTAPSGFSITNMGRDKDRGMITFNWSFTDSIEGGWLKMHEGAGAANKFMARLVGHGNRQLKNGRAIDMVYSQATTASRRLGSNKRLATLNTLLFTARTQPYGYNFAEHDGAFPDNPEFKERLANGRLSMQEWREAMRGDLKFHTDPEINAFLTQQVNRCLEYGTVNPSDYLCSQWQGQDYGVWWEFDALHRQTYEYQNALMKWLNFMMPDLCPDNIDGDWRPCLFKPVTEVDGGSFDFGCLQMQVPHISEETGETWYTWENVYAGWTFGGEDFSGMSKPNVNGSDQMMDMLNTYALQGEIPRGKTLRNLFDWALSFRGRIDAPNNVSFVKPDYLEGLQ